MIKGHPFLVSLYNFVIVFEVCISVGNSVKMRQSSFHQFSNTKHIDHSEICCQIIEGDTEAELKTEMCKGATKEG